MATALPDAAGLAACIAARAGLEQLSRERVRMELLKLLLAPHATPALAVMAESGLLVPVLGGVPDLAAFCEHGQGRSGGGRAGRCGAAARRARRAHRRGCRAAVAAAPAVQRRARAAGVDGAGVVARFAGRRQGRRARCSIGSARERFVDRVLLAWARSPDDVAHDDGLACLAMLPERWAAPVFPLKAADFIKRGVTQGPALGAALHEAEEAWIAADFPADAKAIAAHRRCSGAPKSGRCSG